jgi:teichuronic acid biosynthesis glycosyltransferase TuaG
MRSKIPLISIIMAAYNSGLYIGESIKSVLNQSFTDWELIIVDDGSSDNTREVIERFSNSVSKVKYYYQENQGQAKARNTGLNLAKGELIAFLDSDDLWNKECLSILFESLKRNEVGMVFCSGYRLIENKLWEIPQCELPLCSIKSKAMEAILTLYNPLVIHGVLTYKKFIEQVNGFEANPTLKNCSEDYFLWYKLAKLGISFYGLPDRLAIYRIHNQGTHNNIIKMLEAELFVHTHALTNHYVDQNIVNRLLKFKYRRLIAALIHSGKVSDSKASYLKYKSYNITSIPDFIIIPLEKFIGFPKAFKLCLKLFFPIEYRIENFLLGHWKKMLSKEKHRLLSSLNK